MSTTPNLLLPPPLASEVRGELYDALGIGYGNLRKPEARIELALHKALGNAKSVLNVGAGTGSYEPTDRRVVAVEPALTMIRQRAASAAPAIRASAVQLPFPDRSFDAAMAVLTIHHWPDWRLGVRELCRVARSHVVLLSWDPKADAFWLVKDYFPELIAHDRKIFPSLEEFAQLMGKLSVSAVPIPHDCSDGFLGAYWRRPHAYLEPAVRAAISSFSRVSSIEAGLQRLRRDLESGEWLRRNEHLLAQASLDLGYRLIVASRTR